MENNFISYFLSDILEKKLPLKDTYLILPGKRPEVFIKRYFQQSQYSGFLPQFLSIEQFSQLLAQRTLISGIPLWIEAFQIFISIDPSVQLDNFIKWIPTVLKDFNEIEIYAENPELLLKYMVELERINNFGISSYEDSELLLENKNFWLKLLPFYQKLHATIENKGFATSGRMMKWASINAPIFLEQNPDKYFVFAGFNALSKLEQELFVSFSKSENTFFYWDVDKYYYEEKQQEAGKFLRDYTQKYPAFKIPEQVQDNFSNKKSIKSIAAPKQVMQAKYLASELENIPQDQVKNTAIVLCDEHALNTLLNSLPNNIENINITMGYPLAKNEFTFLFENLMYFHKNAFKTGKFKIKELIGLLESIQNIKQNSDEALKKFNSKLASSRNIYYSKELFPVEENSSISLLLKPTQTAEELLDLCLEFIKKELAQSNHKSLQKAILEKYQEVFEELKNPDLLAYLNLDLLPIFFKHTVKNQQLDFVGEPLEGIQIMGLLETRLLNFDNIYLLNVNEGILPLGRTENSFISFEVKKKFHIHTFLENDAVYAYHFLRFLQRAKDVTMLYSDISEGLKGGEKSRFITQLEIESPHQIEEFHLQTTTHSLEYSTQKTIQKNKEILDRIMLWLQNAKISASALSSYLYNPVGFLEQYIFKIKTEDEYDDHFSALNFGNIIHKTLELLYLPFVKNEKETNKSFTIEALEGLIPEISVIMEQVMLQEKFPEEWFEKGSNLLEKQLAIRMVENLIRNDIKELKEGKIIEILALEKYLECTYLHPTLGELKFQGFLDRIDICDGILRVLDYKTGQAKELKTDNRNGWVNLKQESGQLIQLLLYAKLIFNNYEYRPIKCGIYSLKNLKNGIAYLQIEGSELIDETNLEKGFELVDDLLLEIANPELSFTEWPPKKY